MTDRWCILTTRLGKDVREPTDADLRDALVDVLSAVDEEHPNAWLRVGRDDGPMYVLDVYPPGTILFNQWADADYDKELAQPSVLTDSSLEDAFRLWDALRRGDVDSVQREAWQPATNSKGD